MLPATKTVLVVDDSEANRRLLARILRGLGFSAVVEAGDGKEALQKLKQAPEQFGLVISDWNMPNMNGLELLWNIRKTLNLETLPVIVVSAAFSDKNSKQLFLREGAIACLEKPFLIDELVRIVKSLP